MICIPAGGELDIYGARIRPFEPRQDRLQDGNQVRLPQYAVEGQNQVARGSLDVVAGRIVSESVAHLGNEITEPGQISVRQDLREGQGDEPVGNDIDKVYPSL